MALINKNLVLEYRLTNDNRLEQYTIGQFRDDVMRDRTQLALTKFYGGVRDDWQSDTIKDANQKRRTKRYSFNRDSIEGPRDRGFTAFSSTRFFDEVHALVTRGVISKAPNVYDDDEMMAFFKDLQIILATGSDGIAQRITDAAPSVYLFTELMKRSEIIIEEELTKLWARTIFPVRNLNTWLPMWHWNRVADVDASLPQYVNYDEVPSNIGVSRERIANVIRKLVFYDAGAQWTQHELWVQAEAVANGAINLRLDTRRLNVARRKLLWKENVLTFFGDPEVGILGLMSEENGIERIPAAVKFGDGSAEADRRLLIDTALSIIESTEEAYAPNFIGLPMKPFLHIIARRYGDVSNSSGQTVAGAALETLKEVGIRSFALIPELGYRPAEQTRLQKLGLTETEAKRLSGGINVLVEDVATQVDAMLVGRRDAEVMEMIMAKDVTMYPAAETVRGKTEIRMVQGSGGLEVYQPAAVKLVTNITGDLTLNYEDPEP
jgi:hypothetical protein